MSKIIYQDWYHRILIVKAYNIGIIRKIHNTIFLIGLRKQERLKILLYLYVQV